MMQFPERVVIHPKDVMIISGISKRSAQRLLEKIRKHFQLVANAFVSVEQFCGFTGLKEEKVNVFMK